MPIAWEKGLLKEEVWRSFEDRASRIQNAEKVLLTPVFPDPATLAVLSEHGIGNLKKPATIGELLRRPGVAYSHLAAALGLESLPPLVAEQVETDAKYSGYLQREERRAGQLARMAAVSLFDVDYQEVAGLSNEVIHRLTEVRPNDLAAAARVPGITPAAVSLLAVHLARGPGEVV